MIIQCQSCAAKYFLPEEKVPANPLKVRCPKCRAVFMLVGRRERVVVGVAEGPAPAVAEERIEMPGVTRGFEMPVAARAPVVEAPVEEAPVVQATVTEEPVVEAPVVQAAVAEEPVAPPAVVEAPAAARASRGGKSADDRAKRLARVLVSDILWYNRERRDAALRDGTLMTSLGEEIKKSWELYKEKVGPEAAHSTNYFKEALNEILANGQQVF
jgi:predicted Zn finger-like uncharacterized protein